MKKRTKRIIYIIIAAIIMIMAIIPSFAYDADNIRITFIDTTNENTPVNITLENAYGTIGYIYVTVIGSEFKIKVADSENGILYDAYTMPSIKGSYYHITFYASGDDGNAGTIGRLQDEPYIDGTVSPDVNHQSIIFQILVYEEYEITYEELQQNNDAQYQLGLQFVQQNPLLFGLYREDEYMDYGRQQYLRGKEQGISEAEDENYSLAYNRGKMDGHKDAQTIKGILNIGLTGIYNVFNQVTQNTSIFGISLISIVVSAVVILLIYLIFKLARS